MHEIKIVPGEDTTIITINDITTLPKELPKKWQANELYTVQLTFDLIKARIEKFDLDSPVSTVTRVTILEGRDSRRMKEQLMRQRLTGKVSYPLG